MRVLFVTRAHIGLGQGGLQIQIQRTAECLRERGVEVVYYDPWKDQVEDVQLCHFFSSFAYHMNYHFDMAKSMGKRVVFSPVLGGFDVPLWKVKAQVALAERIAGFCPNSRLLKNMLQGVDCVLALNEQEAERLEKCYAVGRKKMRIIPNGIDRKFVHGEPAVFHSRYGVKDFVFQASSIDPNKNQLAVIRAMRNLPYDYVIAGKPLLSNKNYLDRCKAEAGENVIFTGAFSFDDPMLTSAFAAAKVFVLPSYSEVMPLSIYEAAQAGCRLVVSKNVPLPEEIRRHVEIVDPDSCEQLRNAIKLAMTKQNDADVEHIRGVVLRMPSWQDIGNRILEVYEEIIGLNGS